jgi:predicted Fe-Mo cluster-binding NifX family protein
LPRHAGSHEANEVKGDPMKIAVVSSNGTSVSQHFGRASLYVVLTVEDGAVVARETRPKSGHGTFAGGEGSGSGSRRGVGPQIKHGLMADTIADCDALIAGGMGSGAMAAFRSRGIEPVLTDVRDIDEAALRLCRGDLPNLVDRVHPGRGEH